MPLGHVSGWTGISRGPRWNRREGVVLNLPLWFISLSEGCIVHLFTQPHWMVYTSRTSIWFAGEGGNVTVSSVSCSKFPCLLHHSPFTIHHSVFSPTDNDLIADLIFYFIEMLRTQLLCTMNFDLASHQTTNRGNGMTHLRGLLSFPFVPCCCDRTEEKRLFTWASVSDRWAVPFSVSAMSIASRPSFILDNQALIT